MRDSTDTRFQSRSVFTNIIWKFLERGSSVLVTLLVNVVLARLLDPSVHGLLAMVTVFVAISEIFVTAGLSNALVQKQDADDDDFTTIFWLNVAVSLLLYLLLFFAAPWISRYFGYSELVMILRVLSLRLLVSAVNSVQCAYIARNMIFRHYFFSTLSGKVLSGTVGVLLAVSGAGVWALVAQSLSITIIETAVLWVRVKWRPTGRVSWKRGKQLYGFAYKVMLTSMLETITDQIRNMLIGKHYTSGDLAYYNKGTLFPNCITTNITFALKAVMFPVLASKQTDIYMVKGTCRRWISLFAYIVFPILTGMAAVADIFIPILLSDRWIHAIPFLRIACGSYAAWIIEEPIREAIKATGRANVCLRMQIIKTFSSLVLLLLVYRNGVYAIALTALACAWVNIMISAYYGRKYLGYSPKMLLQDTFPSVLLCGIMALGVMGVPLIIHGRLLCLIAQVTLGVALYWVGSVLLKNSSYQYLLSLFKKKLREE